ncbi:hypothetical protein H5410_050799 [Solanum commersonii]|uniref:Uncharacterized protein n=1 Tax=Solanum commersonii TaxID=4109 RepID=A0A9J5WYN8_SOLCO|nr:hypothetical protein H5410_050799 [Solanum commersonii]
MNKPCHSEDVSIRKNQLLGKLFQILNLPMYQIHVLRLLTHIIQQELRMVEENQVEKVLKN